MTERHRTFAAAVLLTFSLATAVCFVSNNLNSRRQHRDETVAQQIAATMLVCGLAVSEVTNSQAL